MPVPNNLASLAQDIDPVDSGDVARLPAKPNYPWRYVHDRMNWDYAVVDGEPVWLPQFSKLILQPGVSNVRAARQGEEAHSAPTYYDAIKQVDSRGGVVLNDIAQYQSKYPCKGRNGATGFFIAEKFTIPERPSMPGARIKWRMDFDSFNRWRLSLLADGTIAPPTEEETRRYHRAVSARVRRAASDTNKTADQRAEMVERAEKRVAAVEAASASTDATIDKAEEAAPKKPRRRRKSRAEA